MILAAGALHDLFGFRDNEPLGGCFVGFQFSHTRDAILPEARIGCQERAITAKIFGPCAVIC